MIIAPQSRILFKLSGEWLKGSSHNGLCINRLEPIVSCLQSLKDYRWAIMVGGGNFWRRRDTQHPSLLSMADDMGMMGTHMNALALSSVLQYHGLAVELFTARLMEGIGQPYSPQGVLRSWTQGNIAILSGGLGHGCMSTDTASVVRACELSCDILLKGTKVDGVYTSDPVIDPEAKWLPHLTYEYALQHRLGFMDEAALLVARQYRLCTHVISLNEAQALTQWIKGTLRCSQIRE